jgi:serralysin
LGLGLIDDLTDDYGVPCVGRTEDQANLLQHLAWEAAATASGALLLPNAALPIVVFGTEDAQTLSAGSGDDRIYGAGGNDTLLGRGGDDLIQGEQGSYKLRSGGGND